MPPVSESPVTLLWHAAGSPAPCETNGTPVPTREGATHCAMTGGPAAYAWADAFSINYIPPSASNALLPYRDGSSVRVGRKTQVALSAAAVWAAKTLALRCAPWAYEEGRIEFYPSRRYPRERREELAAFYGVEDPPETLEWLLRNRVPPSFIGLPTTGIAHGGEGCLSRCLWPSWPRPADPLIKLQSQQTAVYARASHRQDQATIQVDNTLSITLDLWIWRQLHALARSLLAEAYAEGIAESAVRTALAGADLAPPAGARLAFMSHWSRLTRPFRSHVRHPFWSLFVDLLRR